MNLVNRIEELCNCGWRENKQTLKELKVFNLVILSCNMSGGVRQLLDLTREEVKNRKSRQNTITYTSNRALLWSRDQYSLKGGSAVDALQRRVQEEECLLSKTCFWQVSIKKSKKDHSLAAGKRKNLGTYFDEESLDEDYHGTPNCKLRDAYMYFNADQFPADARAFHAVQSSHKQDTAEKIYIASQTSGIDFYHNSLEKQHSRPQHHQHHQSEVFQQTVSIFSLQILQYLQTV